jgi:hypothetical protein
MRQLVGLLNAAGWTNVADCAMSSGLATVTTTGAIFAATDVGKSLAVAGAGPSSGTLITKITVFTSPTLVTVQDAASTSVTNAALSFGGTFNDDKFAVQLLDESLHHGDERVYTAIADTKGHWARVDIMADSADLNLFSEVPSHIGELGDVSIKYVSSDSDYKSGKPSTRQELEIARRNADSTFNAAHNASGTISAGYYDPEALKDGVCDFTGNVLKIRLAVYTRTSVLQSPEAYSQAILAHAAAEMFTWDGLDPQVALYYSQQADKFEGLIRGAAKVLTELPQLRRAA